MTTTEEVVVSGADFIERRIFLYPEQADVAGIRDRAYDKGYSRGWSRGFLTGAIILGFVTFCIWLIIQR